MGRLGKIEAFVEAAERGSFTLAARQLGVTPSALSRRVAQLEEEIGVRLFHRTTRAVRLSDDGRAFFERARIALRELAEAQAATTALRDRPAGLLRVDAPTIIGRHIVVPAVSQLVARYPDLHVELTLRDVVADIAANGIDVAVRLGALADSTLIARRLGCARMRVCGAPGYFRRHGKPRSVRDLAGHQLLAYAAHGRIVPWRLRAGATIHEVVPSRRVLADAACEESPVHVVSLPTRQVLPKVRAFVDQIASELNAARYELKGGDFRMKRAPGRADP